MGTNLKELLVMDEVSISDFKNKILVIDTFNILYQFITTIRQRDGTPLKDSKGNVTSHLTGLFSRTTKLMKEGLKLAFVFDGKPPELKQKERARRVAIKKEAMKSYEIAAEKKDIEAMKKYAARTSRLTGEMIDESKELIRALGLPVIQAPSEGEAQVAYIANKGDAYAGVSEDYDSLLYGIPRLVKNLTISGRRKFGATYVNVTPKMISISKNLNKLGIDQEQLIILAILVGTDYNPGGVRGIGPKTALKLVKEYKHDFDRIFEEAKWDENLDFDWKDIYYLIKNMPVKKDYKLEFGKINKEKIYSMLVEEHDFSAERVNNAIEALMKEESKKTQKGLGDWVK
ncbi:flap endonuclease-1 [Candidatus Woesearchaeota archaeon]|nr:flap endonuclease-1 [Candidatus Woesearchaeota archaeon]